MSNTYQPCVPLTHYTRIHVHTHVSLTTPTPYRDGQEPCPRQLTGAGRAAGGGDAVCGGGDVPGQVQCAGHAGGGPGGAGWGADPAAGAAVHAVYRYGCDA